VKPWLAYTVIRVSIFLAIFLLLLFVAVPAWLAAIIAVVAGLCIAYIFFRPQRDKLATSLQNRSASQGASTDEEAEDS
jgi:predicted membrane protein